MNNRNRANNNNIAFHERNLRISILSILRRQGGLPRAMLGEKLHLTPAMVTRCIQRMIADHLVQDKGKSKGSGGRMCSNVTLNPSAGVIIGVEYDQLKIVTSVVNFAGISEKYFTFPLPEDACSGVPSKLLPAIIKAIHKSFNNISNNRPLLGIATVDPGVVDISTGVTVAANLLPEWKNVPIQQKLRDAFNVPVYISNTVNAILSAVDRHELNRQYDDIIYLEYRIGIACGIKSNGNQVFGARGMAGELTLSEVEASSNSKDDYSSCYLEQTLGFSGIYKQLLESGHTAFKKDMEQSEIIKLILSLAAEEDPEVQKTICKTWEKLGHIYGTLANILDPAAIVLDPHFGQAGQTALQILISNIHKHMIVEHANQIKIIVSELDETAAPLGAALTLLDNLTFNYNFT